MVYADDIRKSIFKLANQRGLGNAFYSTEVAKQMDSKNWMKLVEQVQLVIESLIQEGYIGSLDNVNGLEKAYTKAPLLEEKN
jgi:hypothetical protein